MSDERIQSLLSAVRRVALEVSFRKYNKKRNRNQPMIDAKVRIVPTHTVQAAAVMRNAFLNTGSK